MHYFLAAIVLLILAFAIPTKFIAIVSLLLLVCSLVVKVSAKIVTRENPPLTSCVKAVIYCFIFTLIAAAVGFKLVPSLQAASIIVIPALVFLAQAYAYKTALSLTIGGGIAVSVCVSIVGWALSHALGLTAMLVA